MSQQIQDTQEAAPSQVRIWPRVLLMGTSYFLVEVFAALILQPETPAGLGFGFFWSWLLTAAALALPRLGGRIFYGVTYYFSAIWVLAQTGYDQLFHKLMWLSDIFYAGEGADYLDTVLTGFSPVWWIGLVVLLAIGGLTIWLFPKWQKDWQTYLTCAITAGLTLAGLFLLPQLVFLRDLSVWGTGTDYMQSTSYRATYATMYNARKVYDICGAYQLTFRDLWKHEIYPMTAAYQESQKLEREELDGYFRTRRTHKENSMTGLYEGKNVILVLMESMDDWMITEEETPTLCRLMDEGINFTNFYTPGYGSVRTFNSEFCVNTGLFLPTTGSTAFDYVTNHYRQSLAALLAQEGYTAQAFHYNSPDFYSRGVYEPAMGYAAYNSYQDYTEDENRLFDDCFLFDDPALSEAFFREGPTLNFLITRSAHLSYVYNEVLSVYALEQYPEYQGMFGHEEEDCARVKARLVDDMFARLLEELEARGELENTVIVAFTDHYTYGFKDVDKLMELSGVESELLLEKTPCFIWSADGPDREVKKTLNTSDLLPTVLNLLGVDSPYRYLGQDAFDPNYEGCAFFPDGSWISDGVACMAVAGGEPQIILNEREKELTPEYLEEMTEKAMAYVSAANLLLTTDYYKTIR